VCERERAFESFEGEVAGFGEKGNGEWSSENESSIIVQSFDEICADMARTSQ
jgi:hypothetical protein